jgi:iron complex transport system ATP-binding protein
MSARLLDVRGAACGYRGKAVVRDIDLSLDSGEILCLLGPNGSGKTTLFKTILGTLAPMSGSIAIRGRRLSEYSLRELARHVAYVPQAQYQAFPFTVIDVVALGRCSHLGAFSSPGARDYRIASECLERLGVSRLEESIYTEISGGERQMALIARALAQEPEMLVMDEPTSNLDFGNQVRLLGVAKSLAEAGIGIVMTTHFPDHAFLAGDRVAVLNRGAIVASGRPDDIIDEELMRSTYGIAVRVIDAEAPNGARMKTCIPTMEALS